MATAEESVPLNDGPEPADDPLEVRRCRVCDVRLSVYNTNPYCWQHAIGNPWRGPNAKPR